MGIISSFIVVMVLIYVVGVAPAALAYIAIITLILPVFILATALHSIEQSRRLRELDKSICMGLDEQRHKNEEELEHILSLKEGEKK